jgi:SAM-dependent methyltransferase
MDQTTEAVREMYEQYPYPAGVPTMRLGSDARRVLSLGTLERKVLGPITVLDAGCGRGLGTLGQATLQPDVLFVGVDLSRTSLQHARDAAKQRNLDNISFHEVDLMTLEGLEVPRGGFDVIMSSGVVHHLSDPVAGLARLRDVLAPHGVLSMMVYGKSGREPLYRLVRAIDALIDREQPLPERLRVGRALAAANVDGPTSQGPWSDAASVSDVEFVDRYLNVNETSYDIDGLWQLIEGAGLRFLEWCDPKAWSCEALLPNEPLRAAARKLSPKQQYRLIEQMLWRHRLEVYVCHPENELRATPSPSAFSQQTFAVSPEVAFETQTRALAHGTRVESLKCRVGDAKVAIDLPPGPVATAVLVLKDHVGPFTGREFNEVLAGVDVPPQAATEALQTLVANGIVYPV